MFDLENGTKSSIPLVPISNTHYKMPLVDEHATITHAPSGNDMMIESVAPSKTEEGSTSAMVT